jgi:hypothetical protein
MKRYLLLSVILLAWSSQASAITVDGVRDGDYGSALAVQAVQTQFGDEGAGCDDCGGELDAAYAKIEGGRLYLMITGNLESDNFNKMEVFIDSKAGGENMLTNVPEYDFFNAGTTEGFEWTSRNLGGTSGTAGMTFDTGFTADYHMFARGGFGNYEVDFIDRNGGTTSQVPGARGTVAHSGVAGAQTAIGTITAGTTGPNASGSSLTQNLDIAWDNSNDAGVSGGTVAADQVAAAAVTTGMEFSIALADLGNPSPGSTINIAAFYGNSNHNYMSNQALGTYNAPQANLGGNGSNPGEEVAAGGFTGTMEGFNLNNFAGDQYFSIIVPAAGPDGDFNEDGFVDAADYVAWRKVDNSEIGYDAFVQHFGETIPGGSPNAGGSGGVPEPSSLLLVALGSVLAIVVRRRG